ncbi:unnamed protein product [Prunus brigantina]
MEMDGHSRLLGGLINLLDGCAVRYFDLSCRFLLKILKVQWAVGFRDELRPLPFVTVRGLLLGPIHGYSDIRLPFGKLGDAHCRGAKGHCRRSLPKGIEKWENDRSFLCRFPQTAPNC